MTGMADKTKWRLGVDQHPKDNVLDGFTYQDVIDALHQCKVISPTSAKKVVMDILSQRHQDMWYLFENNLDIIVAEARKGRADYAD